MPAPNLARKSSQYVLSICEPAVLKWFHLDTYLGSSIVLTQRRALRRIAHVPADLLEIASACSIPHPHGRPAEFGH
jgi:hypothetical protein